MSKNNLNIRFDPTKGILPNLGGAYFAEYQKAMDDPEAYYGEIAKKALYWRRPWNKYVEYRDPIHKFFVGGLTNYTYWFDIHENSWTRNKLAYIWEGEPTDDKGNPLEIRRFTYDEMWRSINRFSKALLDLGIRKGDRIGIYMPMVPEALIAAFSAVRIGAIHVIVFSGFGAEALANRLADSKSRILITADGGYRRSKFVDLKSTAEKAFEKVSTLEKMIVVNRSGRKIDLKQGRDLAFDELMASTPSNTYVEPTWLEANEPVYIVYTSGTVGKPKGIVHTSTHYVWLWANMYWAFDLNEQNVKKDVWFFTGDFGWAGGHFFTIYTPPMFGLTAVFYEGAPDTPAPDRYWSIVDRYGVTVLYTSPTAVRMFMSQGDHWVKKHDLSTLRILGSVGEPLNAEAWKWFYEVVGKGRLPIIDTYGQTETIVPIFPPYGIDKIPLKPGSATVPLPAIEADVVDEDGKPIRGEKGYLVYKVPFKAPTIFLTMWGDADNFGKPDWIGDPALVKATYYERFPGYYYTGDAALIDEDGYFWLLGRADDTLKIAGHRLGTAEIENAFLMHPAVGEAAVVGKPDQLRGEVAVAFIVLRPGFTASPELAKELKESVRKALGPIVVVDRVFFVPKIPKNRSGKVLRRVVRALVRGENYGDVSTIDDSSSIDEIRKALDSGGY
ncbi:MAG: acetate--CoA ligase [Thermocladium sp.]